MIKLQRKYRPLFTSDARYFIVTGGRGSAKSFGVNTFLTALSYEQGHRILFTRYTMTAAKLSIIPEFNEKIALIDKDQDFKVADNEVYNKTSQSSIIFKGLKTSSGDQTAALKSLTGVTTWILDEAEELTDETIFDKIDLSVRQKGVQNRVVLVMNPATKEHWIYKRFFEEAGVQPGFNGEKGDVCYIHTTYLDNVNNLDASFIRQAEKMLKIRPKKYAHQMLGEWLDKADGVVFTNWKIGEFNNNLQYLFGQDYGFSIDPTTLIRVAVDKPGAKIYLKEECYTANMTTSQIAEVNARVAGQSLIVGDSAEPRLIKELKGKGCNIKEAVKGPGSVSAGIALMQDYELIIDPESTNLIKELNNYVYSDKKSKLVAEGYDHAIDAARYAVTYQLSNPNRGNYAVH